MRTTTEYSFLLAWSTAPDHLTSNAAHDLAFELLAKHGAALGESLEWIDHEKPQLWRRDVPTFYGNTTSRRVTDSAGVDIGPELPRSAVDQMVAALKAMSEEDLIWQRELLVGSLRMALDGCQESGVGCQMSGFRASDNGTDTRHPTPDTILLTEALRLGEALDRLALRSPLGATWLTLEWEPHDPQQVMLGPVRSGLFSGGAGIALFLSNLSVAAQEPTFAALARDALRFAAANEEWTVSKWPGYRDRLAAFGSPYSQVYALAECGRVLGDESLLERAIDFALCQSDRPEVTNPDFINGAAGAICVLLHLHTLRPDDRLLNRAVNLAESIHALNGDGHGWRPDADSRPLLGLAHGQIGIALAFDRLARYVDLPWASGAVAHAQEYEARHFDVAAGDWPNLQRNDPEQHFMVGWCGGAPGHGLARLRLLGGLADESALRNEIDHALTMTLRDLGPAPENLCCGVPGRLWFLAEAGRQLGRPQLMEAARAGALRLIADRRERGYWHLRPVSERETLPTLMGGIAGIGLTLLEVRQPGSVSQVVTLS
jgi:type 2 lantibiotic biosynthesis protein LanM